MLKLSFRLSGDAAQLLRTVAVQASRTDDRGMKSEAHYAAKLANVRAGLLAIRQRKMWPSGGAVRLLLGEAALCKRVIRYMRAHAV